MTSRQVENECAHAHQPSRAHSCDRQSLFQSRSQHRDKFVGKKQTKTKYTVLVGLVDQFLFLINKNPSFCLGAMAAPLVQRTSLRQRKQSEAWQAMVSTSRVANKQTFSEPRISDRKTTGETRSNAICLAPRPKKPKSVIIWNGPPKYGKVHPTSAINSGKIYDSE